MTENRKSCEEPTSPLQNAIHDTKLKYGSGADFMLIFNKDIQLKTALHTERAYLGNAPTLNTVRLSYSNELLTIWIMAQLEDINDFVAVKQKMTLAQMEQTANIIATEYSYLKVTEIHLFLHRLKSGRYGTFYGCIDPLQLMQALNQFLEQRRTEINQIEQRNKQQLLDQQRAKWAETAVTRQEYEQIKKHKS